MECVLSPTPPLEFLISAGVGKGQVSNWFQLWLGALALAVTALLTD